MLSPLDTAALKRSDKNSNYHINPSRSKAAEDGTVQDIDRRDRHKETRNNSTSDKYVDLQHAMQLHFLPLFFVFLAAMKVLGIALPTFLLSQIPSATAWAVPSYDAEHDKLGAVASESSVCTDIGIDVLKAGGNAADSLVATVLCVGVIGMYHS